MCCVVLGAGTPVLYLITAAPLCWGVQNIRLLWHNWYLGEEMKARGQALLPHLLLSGRCLSLLGISLGQTAKESPFWRISDFLSYWVF